MHHFASIAGNRLTHASTEGVKKIKKNFSFSCREENLKNKIKKKNCVEVLLVNRIWILR